MDRQPFWNFTATELTILLRRRACSAVEITQSCLNRISEREHIVRAFVELDADGALRQAAELDRRGETGPLHGIPVAIKDTVDVEHLHCTLGTEIHKDRVPAHDATVVGRLRNAGAVILGTTVSTEYAIARAGPTRNPHNPGHTPGGSSSGSAAAVAARMVPLAVATQTVGSIVRPSTYCGIFGLKPTKDAISTTGAMTLSPRLDHIGPMARCIDDLWLAYLSMCDSGAVAGNIGIEERKLTDVLLVEGPLRDRIEPASREALNRARSTFEANGIPVKETALPNSFKTMVNCWETILFRDLAVNHGDDRDHFGSKMSDRFLQIIDLGRKVTDRAYEDAITEAQYLRMQLLGLLPKNAIILAPATDGAAPAFSEQTGPSYLQGLWSLAGFPALAIPCGKVGDLPVGVQLVGHPMQEQFVLQAGKILEGLGRDN
jgi:Asp-tRNA(Asn)/Glu-tRNA(Gln) amidotransferase A subunit family amidase